MSKCRRLKLLSILSLVFIGLCGGTTLAGTDGTLADQVSFSLTDSSAYTYHTRDGNVRETATLYFKVAFDAAQPGNYLQQATIRLEYDPDFVFVELDGIRPAADWGFIVNPVPIITEGAPGLPTTVTYILDPDPGASTIEISQTPVALAEFDFHVMCQEVPQTTPINIVYGGALTTVDDGTNVHHVTDPDNINHGSVGRWMSTPSAWLAEGDGTRDYVGALGSVIEVPLFIGGSFKVASVDATFTYDVTKLEYVGLTGADPSLTDTASSFPTSGQVRVELGTDEATYPRHEFNGGSGAIDLNFRVLGSWQNGSTTIDFAQPVVFEVAQDYGTCTTPMPTTYDYAGIISIPEYTAGFSTELLDGFFSLLDDEAEVQVNLTNNFPAGLEQDSIIANFNLGTDLEGKWITDEEIDFAMFTFGGGPVDDEEVSLRRYLDEGYMDSSTDPQAMVTFRVDKSDNFVTPAAYDDRFTYFTHMSPFDGYPQFSSRVVDTTNGVNLSYGNGLTWDQPDPIEFKMGEYYCAYTQGGNCDVTQVYRTQHNFTLNNFRVKITVAGAHHMYEVIPVAGVILESFDDVNYKWAILASDPDATMGLPPTTDRTEFASITYTRSAGSNLMLKESNDLPGDPEVIGPGTGHYVTRTSTITFDYYEEDEFYMKEPGSDEQHWVVATSNNVVSKWWVDLSDPRDNISLWGAELPEDYELLQNYPNPFNPSTEISFGLPAACGVQLDIYNVAGQLVETLVSEQMSIGWHTVTWDGAGFASGIYLYRLQAGQFTQSQKMILLK